MRTFRMVKFIVAFALVAAALPSSALGQATRTWVSGVGDDANPCSRTAPCKTFAGAQSKTATGGEINAIDGGGFGAITINKSLTIDGRGAWHAGILTNVSNGIVVNTVDANARVVIRGLNIVGLSSNFHGVRILQARSVKIVDTHIQNWGKNGISFEPTGNPSRLVVSNSRIHDNGGNGVLVAPPTGAGARATLRRNEIDDNACGVAATRFGVGADFNVDCGTGSSASGVSGTAVVNVYGNEISDNTNNGVLSSGSSSTVRLRNNNISTNFNGILSLNSGVMQSYGGNVVTGNPGTNGTATATFNPIR